MSRLILEYLERQPKGTGLALSGALWLIVSTIDFLVQIDMGLSIFYLLPVMSAAWLIGPWIGLAMACLCTFTWFHADGMAKDYPLAFLPYWNAAVRFCFFVIITSLLAALKEAYQREQLLARLDGLTGINNHRFFLELLQSELDRARRHQYPLTLAYLDLDGFKGINDQWGHSAGDQLLKAVAQTLKTSVRSHDVIGRLGGDEFAILLPQTNLDQAKIILTRIQHLLQTLNKTAPWPVGFSIGAVTFVTLPDATDILLSQADQIMYAVKRSGKNRLECRQY
jgi:diguanylate cyclase (GGDEF)-like protein